MFGRYALSKNLNLVVSFDAQGQLTVQRPEPLFQAFSNVIVHFLVQGGVAARGGRPLTKSMPIKGLHLA
jgi:hypothetical protein